MPKKLFCCKKKNNMSDLCAECRTKVKSNDGVQCQGPCGKWRHYRCLDVSACKIHAIKTGEVVLRCPCPDCEPSTEEWRPPCTRGLPCPPDPYRDPQGITSRDDDTQNPDPYLYEPEPVRSRSSYDRRRPYDDYQDPRTVLEEPQQPRIVREREDNDYTPGEDYRNKQRFPDQPTRFQMSPMPPVARMESNRPDDPFSRSLPEYNQSSRLYRNPSAAPKQISTDRYPTPRAPSNFTPQPSVKTYSPYRDPQELQSSTEQLRRSLTELKQGVEVLRMKQDAVENCFQSMKQMCQAVDALSKKIDEVCDRVKETVDDQGTVNVMKSSSGVREGRMCFCPNNPDEKIT